MSFLLLHLPRFLSLFSLHQYSRHHQLFENKKILIVAVDTQNKSRHASTNSNDHEDPVKGSLMIGVGCLGYALLYIVQVIHHLWIFAHCPVMHALIWRGRILRYGPSGGMPSSWLMFTVGVVRHHLLPIGGDDEGKWAGFCDGIQPFEHGYRRDW